MTGFLWGVRSRSQHYADMQGKLDALNEVQAVIE